ncbi:type II toxin-antitoxin system HicB family antitoxin [Rhodococcus sp. NPDC055024]
MTNTYTATVTREGRWWLIEFPDFGAVTQARRIGEAELMAREVIALHTGQAVDDVAVDLHINDIGRARHIAEKAGQIQHHKNEAAFHEAEALKESKRLAQELSDEGVSVRDIGDLLKVSFQRAHQLVQH